MKLNSIFSCLCLLSVFIIFGCSDTTVSPNKNASDKDFQQALQQLIDQGVIGPERGLHVGGETDPNARLSIPGATTVFPTLSGRILRSVLGTSYNLTGKFNRNVCMTDNSGFVVKWGIWDSSRTSWVNPGPNTKIVSCLSTANLSWNFPVTQRTQLTLLVSISNSVTGQDYGYEYSNAVTIAP